MDKVNESGTGEQFIGESEEMPLGSPASESVNRFDAILLGNRKVGKRKRGGSGEDGSPRVLGRNSRTYGEEAPFAGRNSDSGEDGSPRVLGRNNRTYGEEENEERKRLDKKSYRKVTKNVKFGGDVILSSLLTSSEFHRAETVKAEKQANSIRSIGTEIAEKILASAAALNAKQEVRIMLKNSILPNTEIVLSKDGKMLSVNFFTSASESASLLSSKQAELRLHLLNTLHDVNDVDVNIYQEASTESEDSHDGRSRGEYVGDYDDNVDGNKNKRRN
ncbi:MAG: hypothetical protein LBB15_02590 [Puniceicoccales bacterium]|jgi:hypothetical protein|nr:hypothetical protein [Puniceicoccales bacterium]